VRPRVQTPEPPKKSQPNNNKKPQSNSNNKKQILRTLYMQVVLGTSDIEKQTSPFFRGLKILVERITTGILSVVY
jgi:hypothetical protein